MPVGSTCNLNELFNDVLGRWQVRIAHTEVDDVFTDRACCGSHRIGFSKHIGCFRNWAADKQAR